MEKIIIYGDTRTGNRIHQQIINKIKEEKPDYIFHTGDTCEDPSINQFWNQFTNIVDPLKDKMYLCLGNHEENLNFKMYNYFFKGTNKGNELLSGSDLNNFYYGKLFNLSNNKKLAIFVLNSLNKINEQKLFIDQHKSIADYNIFIQHYPDNFHSSYLKRFKNWSITEKDDDENVNNLEKTRVNNSKTLFNTISTSFNNKKFTIITAHVHHFEYFYNKEKNYNYIIAGISGAPHHSIIEDIKNKNTRKQTHGYFVIEEVLEPIGSKHTLKIKLKSLYKEDEDEEVIYL